MEAAAPPLSPGQLAWLEVGLALLRGTALPAIERMSVMLLVSGYVRNEGRMAVQGGDTTPERGGQVARLIDPARFPALSAIIESGAFTAAPFEFDHFAYGLGLILDSVEAQASHQMTDDEKPTKSPL